MSSKKTALLAIAPVYRGLGYIAFNHNRIPIDWGTVENRNRENAARLRRARVLIETFAPKVVVLEQTDSPSCRRKPHFRALISKIAGTAKRLGCEVALYDRVAIADCLDLERRAIKDVQARAIAKRLPAIAHCLPKPRRIWESEKHAMAMFTAAGLALAHFQRLG